MLDSIEILIPYGVTAVAGVAVFYGEYQLTPKPDGEFITGNGETIKDPIKWELPERKTYLRILAYNESQNSKNGYSLSGAHTYCDEYLYTSLPTDGFAVKNKSVHYYDGANYYLAVWDGSTWRKIQLT